MSRSASYREFALLQVCLGHDGKAVVDTEDDESCDRLCGQGKNDQQCTVGDCVGAQCTTVVDSCPQPHVCPKQIYYPVAAMPDDDVSGEQGGREEM